VRDLAQKSDQRSFRRAPWPSGGWAVQLVSRAGSDAGLRPLPVGLPGKRDPVVSAARAAGGANGLDLVFCTHDHIDHPRSMDAPAAGQRVARRGGRERRRCACLTQPRCFRPSASSPAGGYPASDQGCGDLADPAATTGWRMQSAATVARATIVRVDGVTICHTGDTVMYDGLVERLRSRQVDVLWRRINGLDYFRTKRHRWELERAGSRRPAAAAG